MFNDFAPRLAAILTEYSVPVQKDDYVGIIGSIQAEPLLLALYEAVLERGGHPFIQAGVPGVQEIFYAKANEDQLAFCDPLTLAQLEKVDLLYQIIAPSNTKSLSQVDPQILKKAQAGRRPIMELYFKRINEESLRWNITAWPTQASAQEAEMGLLAYTEFMYKACALDQTDPLAHWKSMRERQDRLVGWLKGKRHAEVKGPGIEMSFDFTERPWINCWGDKNFPDGEVFTSPIEDSVNGHVEFNFPTMYSGREVNGVKFTFKDGRIIEASAEKNEEYLMTQLDIDEGARSLGEFAVGTNMGIQRFTGETLFDEKIGGSIHMAIGLGIAESGGLNQSQIHWDMVHSMKNGGEITIDGELFYKNGDFVVGG